MAAHAEEAGPGAWTPSVATAQLDEAQRHEPPLTPETPPRSIRGVVHHTPGSALRLTAEPLTVRESQCSNTTLMPPDGPGSAVRRGDPFINFAGAEPEESLTDPRNAVFLTERGSPEWGQAERRDERPTFVPRGDCVDMSRYLQEPPRQPPGPPGSEPVPARPEKMPMLSRDADRDRKCRDSVRDLQSGKGDEDGLSNPCVNLQQKLLGIRVAAAGVGAGEGIVEESHHAAQDDAASVAYKRRSFADTYHL